MRGEGRPGRAANDPPVEMKRKIAGNGAFHIVFLAY
jgi:hypothetical protein